MKGIDVFPKHDIALIQTTSTNYRPQAVASTLIIRKATKANIRANKGNDLLSMDARK
jgi:hypothetical protein